MRRALDVIKYIVIVLAYGFVIYKTFTYKNYVALLESVASFSMPSLLYVLLFVVFLPLNIGLEAEKWKRLVSPVCVISFFDSVKSVLVGFVGALSTPNKLGDFPIRSIYMPEGKRAAATAAGFIGSWVQIVVIIKCGLPSLFFLERTGAFELPNVMVYVVLVLLSLMFIVTLFFLLPYFSKLISRSNTFVVYLYNISKVLKSFTIKQIFEVSLLTCIRYLVFSFQFYIALLAFGVDLAFVDALYAIPVVYLLITITPSIVFTDLIVRTSYSVMVLSVFSSNILSISLASTFVWFVNTVFPMIVGSILMFNKSAKS